MRITKKHITEAVVATKQTTEKNEEPIEKVTNNDINKAKELEDTLKNIKDLEKEVFGIEEAENKRNTKEIIKVSELKKQESEFAESRLNGAKNISSNAKDKGGFSLLTYHHFKVKLPYYKKAINNELDFEKAKKDYSKLLEKLYNSTKEELDIEQIEFQELVGKLEVLGELLIEKKNEKNNKGK